ncbi:MAG: LuxR family transcriptional regulator [Bacteroidales bacterium]|nr:LuxR family transcriptional regulator [Bacteroidales bacterium]
METKGKLSRREFQVAELLAWGAAKKEIPDLLRNLYGGRTISVHTVENITRRIYEKLGINKTGELAAWYFCECHKVDEDLSPIRKVKKAIYSILFLLILIPQTFDFDQDILRPQRIRTTRVERVVRTRKKD